MKTFGTTLMATIIAGAALTALPASAQQINTKLGAMQQETAAAARLDYQYGEAMAYGRRAPRALPGRIDTLYERPVYHYWN